MIFVDGGDAASPVKTSAAVWSILFRKFSAFPAISVNQDDMITLNSDLRVIID